jgi:NADH dehydrogenase
MEDKVPHVVIVGGGFGGLNAARALAKAPVNVTLVDKRNHHLFQPLLYQVATAALSAPDIAAPIRKLVASQDNTTVLLDRVQAIDTVGKKLTLDDSELSYDFLILATGMTNDYFGHPEWEPHAPGLKSLEDALEIRRRVLLAYEAAEGSEDEKERHALQTFIVIGGGATGVELSGALAEISRRTMTHDFRHFNPQEARVILLEGGDRLLPAFPQAISDRALADLKELGVEVRLNTRASKIDEHGVLLGTKRIRSRTVLWAAGVRGVPVLASLGVKLDRAGRVPVQPDLLVEGLDGVFVIGDAAAFATGEKQTLPGVAQVALQQGDHAARNIQLSIKGQPLKAFVYKDLGSMATIGRNRAVAVAGKLQFTGFLGWLAWLFVHLMALVGFRNRVVVLLEWTWAYLSYQRSARLILETAVGRSPARLGTEAAKLALASTVAAAPEVRASVSQDAARVVASDP